MSLNACATMSPSTLKPSLTSSSRSLDWALCRVYHDRLNIFYKQNLFDVHVECRWCSLNASSEDKNRTGTHKMLLHMLIIKKNDLNPLQLITNSKQARRSVFALLTLRLQNHMGKNIYQHRCYC